MAPLLLPLLLLLGLSGSVTAAAVAAGRLQRPQDTDSAVVRSAVDAASGRIGTDIRVPVDLFVMSKCPDALRCEARMNQVLQLVGNLTSVQLNFIANIQPGGGDLVTCKHGDLECAGDAQQLCVQHLAKKEAQVWSFVQCIDSNTSGIGQEYLADQCLAAVLPPGSTADAIKACYYGREGTALLYNSADYVRSLGVQTSCTIWMGDRPRCVHDGGVWYNCPGGPEVLDFVSTICNLYWQRNGVWPPECKKPSAAAGSP